MKNNQSYYFIINPVSGNGKGKIAASYIQDWLEAKKRKFLIRYTEKPGDAPRLVREGIAEGFDIIVAVGGDGTINEIVNELTGTSKIMGIIPIGSGNGLARELNIPVNIKAAVKLLLNGHERKIDVGICGEHYFACTAGVGFDAHMGEKFKNLKSRGLAGYIKTFIQEFFNYTSSEYRITTQEKEITVNAFLISIANCRQWGNNFYISPKSKNNDGLMEVCIIRKFPKIMFPTLVFRLLCKTIHQSRYYSSISSEKITISGHQDLILHTDGEPVTAEKSIGFYTKKAQLSVISGF